MKVTKCLIISILAIAIGCKSEQTICKIPAVASMCVNRNYIIEEDDTPIYIYNRNSVKSRRGSDGDSIYIEIDSDANAEYVIEAINMSMAHSGRRFIFFWNCEDGSEFDDMALDISIMPLCPVVNLESYSRVVKVDLVRGNRVFVNGICMPTFTQLSKSLKDFAQGVSRPEIVIRADKFSKAWALRNIVYTCVENNIWDIYLTGHNTEGHCTVCPINMPVPGLFLGDNK